MMFSRVVFVVNILSRVSIASIDSFSRVRAFNNVLIFLTDSLNDSRKHNCGFMSFLDFTELTSNSGANISEMSTNSFCNFSTSDCGIMPFGTFCISENTFCDVP